MSQDKPQVNFSPATRSATHSLFVLGSLLRSISTSKGGNGIMLTGSISKLTASVGLPLSAGEQTSSRP